MPAAPLANVFEGGSDTTVITAANSGGASGDAFSAVLGNPTFSVDHPHSGSLGMKVDAASEWVNWTGLGSLTTDVWIRFYYWVAAKPVGSDLRFARFHTNTGATSGYLSHRDDNGFLMVLNAAGTGTAVGSVVVATSQLVRIECRIRSATSNGQMEWRLYNSADSATIDDTNSSSTMVLGANTDEAKFGNSTTTPTTTFYMDDVAVSTAGWIGPSVAGSATILRPAQVT
jgi:hypothetical protein